MTERSRDKEVAIIGAGPGGLAAAMLLAKAGVKVTVFEKDDVVGGRTKTIADGSYRFDVGPTFFLFPQILESIFSRCGLDLTDYITLKRVDPSYRIAFENGPDVRVAGNMAALQAAIAKINPKDAERIPDFIARNRRKLADFKPILERPFLSLFAYLAPNVLKALHWIVPFRSVDSELADHFEDPRVRLIFSFQTKYLGMSPFRCPNLFTFLSFLEYEFGVWHPMGGCGAVSEGMARAARDLGVTFRLGTPVEEITFEGRKARAIRTASGETRVDAAVINGDFAAVAPKLIPARLRRHWSDARIERKKYSCSTFMLYLGIDGAYDVDHHTIFLSQDYAANIREIEEAVTPPTTPSIYVCNPGRTDPTFARDGNASLYVLVPVGHCGKIDWAAEKQAFRNKVIARLEGLGFDGLSGRIRAERVLTPEDWRDQLAIYRGATFNLAHGLDQMLYFRPHNRMPDVEGVYLVGGGTHPGSGLPVIYEGARISTDLLLADLGLRPARTPEMPVARGEAHGPFSDRVDLYNPDPALKVGAEAN